MATHRSSPKTPPPPLSVSAYALSHPGKVRAYQEDAFLLGDRVQPAGVKDLVITEAELPCDGTIAAVIDGMGGMGGGDIASTWLARRWAGRHVRTAASLLKKLREDHHVLLETALRSDTPLMGAVATGVALLPNGALLFHAGDTRAYLVRAHSCTLLTTDHVGRSGNVEQCFGGGLLRGELTPLDPQIIKIPRWDNGLLLILSDGAWSSLRPSVLRQVYAARPEPKDFLLILASLVLEGKADDNLTLLALGSPS